MQRRFNFRLERVLRVRNIEERVARADWGAAQSELREAQEDRDARSNGVADSRRSLGVGRLSGQVNPARNLLAERTLDAEVFGLQGATERVFTKLAHAERLAAVWRGREQDRRALTELEERARDGHRKELEASENAEMDEVAIGRMTQRRQNRREHPGSAA